MGKALTIGVLIGVAVSFIGVGGAFLAGGQGWGPALGMGAFVAAWGGLGFGVMVGGVVWLTRADEAAKRARLEPLEGSIARAPQTGSGPVLRGDDDASTEGSAATPARTLKAAS